MLRDDALPPTSAAEDVAAPTPSVSSSATSAPGSEQPWLQPGFIGADDVPLDVDEVEDYPPPVEVPAAPGRLVGGVQGLLEPIRVATAPGEGSASLPPATTALTLALDPDRLRRTRALMGEEPVLASAGAMPSRRSTPLWIPWIFLAIGLAVAIPVLLQLVRPGGGPRQWPGVAGAYAAVDTLPPQAVVQVLWAYDPATAGEMDLVAAPLVRHLLARGTRTSIYSLLPNGPATARRLYGVVQEERASLRTYTPDPAPAEARFLPGGSAILPLLGQERADLALVFAAQAEDVQVWLEQVAPLNRTPVVAATAAGADPMLRPYLESGQLVGLVSGFDGAASYAALMEEPPARTREQVMNIQVATQNVALWMLLALLLGGNVVALLSGRRSDG